MLAGLRSSGTRYCHAGGVATEAAGARGTGHLAVPHAKEVAWGQRRLLSVDATLQATIHAGPASEPEAPAGAAPAERRRRRGPVGRAPGGPPQRWAQRWGAPPRHGRGPSGRPRLRRPLRPRRLNGARTLAPQPAPDHQSQRHAQRHAQLLRRRQRGNVRSTVSSLKVEFSTISVPLVAKTDRVRPELGSRHLT